MRTSVYVIAAENGPVKIGIAQNPFKRLKELQTGAASPLRVAYVQEASSPRTAKEIERSAHEAAAGASLCGEWFDLSVDAASRTIRSAARRVRTAKPNAASIRPEKGPVGRSSSVDSVSEPSKEPEHPATLDGEALPASAEATTVSRPRCWPPALVLQHLPVSGAQIRAARAFSRQTVKDLARSSTQSVAVIEAAEAAEDMSAIPAESVCSIAIALYAEGVRFTPCKGVRYRKDSWKVLVGVTPHICRAARAMLGWRIHDLTDKLGIGPGGIYAFEMKADSSKLRAKDAVLGIFEQHGLELIPDNGFGPGVRFRERQEKKDAAQD